MEDSELGVGVLGLDAAAVQKGGSDYRQALGPSTYKWSLVKQ